MAIMNLPPIPPELKSISPYLQRSDELSSQDPVMSYWCAYYGAQVGIALKPKDTPSRTFLFNLLGVLEQMKAEIGQNDAVEDESAASAYVENFALKVFAMADNEDRRGEATRKTAKKFLAAANFLELLRIFEKDKPDLSSADSNAEKIRYAKWKAADIAKAFREGRKPALGPPGTSSEPENAAGSSSRVSSPGEGGGTPALTRTTPPPPAITDMPAPPQDSFFAQSPQPSLLSHSDPRLNVQTPGAWSTAATPGTPGQVLSSSGEDVSTAGARQSRSAWVSGEMEGREVEEEGDIVRASSPGSKDKGVRFTPSVIGGVSTPGAELPHAQVPDQSLLATPPASYTPLPSAPPAELEGEFPAGFVPEVIAPDPDAPPVDAPPPGFVSHGGQGIVEFGPQFVAPVPPPPQPAASVSAAPVTPPPPPSVSTYRSPPAQAHSPLPSSPNAPITLPSAPMVPPVPQVHATITPTAVELTPVEVARAQKHCRFAISALDYDDAEQARKELRAALKLLGG